ncbi:MAG: signal peptidase I [Chitinivibrionales bacterium]|nr:signal peptidase I [Chitinivibrionales bacterium]
MKNQEKAGKVENPNNPTLDNVSQSRRNEKAGMLNFTKEMVSALLMAFVAIVYVIQAFKIPSGSMENSLLTGDFLLGLKFIYGAPVLPFSYLKFPGITSPHPGDVVIFKYPGSDNKDYIKRCIAGPGQTLQIDSMSVIIDGKTLSLPPRGKYRDYGNIGLEGIRHFAPLRIPKKGDVLLIEQLPIREFLFAKHLIHQEHPDKNIAARVQNVPLLNALFISKPEQSRVSMKFPVFIDGVYKSDANIPTTVDQWTILEMSMQTIQRQLQEKYPASQIEIRKKIFLNNKPITQYEVQNDNYFMMGDNRDNSLDSRYWGYLNKNFVKAKAFILYFSLAHYYELPNNEIKYYPHPIRYRDGAIVRKTDSEERLADVWKALEYHRAVVRWDEKGQLIGNYPKTISPLFFPLKIRWNRIGKLIRGWDGSISPSTAAY